MRGITPHRPARLVAASLLLASVSAGAAVFGVSPAAAMAGSPPIVQPAAGAVLSTGPGAVQVRFPSPPAAPVQLQVVDARGAERGDGGVAVRGAVASLPVRDAAAGTYTVLWAAGGARGSSTFTVWRGGALPPALERAAYGGPTAAAAGFWLGLWTVLALAGALFFLGGAVTAADRGGRAAPRLGATALAAGGVLAALERVALAIGQGYPGALHSPLWAALIGRGVALDDLLAAGLGLLGSLVLRRSRLSAAAAAALGLALLLGGLPLLRSGPLLAAWLGACGLALAAGGLPGRRGGGARSHGLRLLGAALAALGGTLLALKGSLVPATALGTSALLGVDVGVAGSVLALACGVLPRPRRGLAACGSLALLLAAAGLGPVLAQPSALARGILPLPAHPGFSAADRGVTLQIASLQAGTDTLEVRDPSARTPLLAVHLVRAGGFPLSRTVVTVRVAPGVFAARTDALSLPGRWRAAAAGAGFTVDLGGAAAKACRSFPGQAARWARLGGPVLALAADPGDADAALASTAAGVFATADGGLDWTAVGDPGPATDLAVDRYGQWWAATPSGLRTSRDGGNRWLAVPGLAGAAGAVFTPLYPSGVPLWAVLGGTLFERTWQTTFTGLQTSWGTVGPAPRGADVFVAMPPTVVPPAQAGPVRWQGQAVPMLAGGPSGIWQSPSDGTTWVRVLDQPVTDVAVGASALWAVGPGGLYTAALAAGPWRKVQGPAGITQIAAAGPSGDTLFAAQPGGGLLRSADGGRTWTAAGCPVGTVTLLRGTYQRGRPPAAPSAPALYLADGLGDVVAVMPPARGAR